MMADRIVGGENRRGVRDVPRPPWPFLSHPHAVQRRGGARRARSAISRLRANVSVEYPPCLRAFLLPLGAPPPAPWTRQTREPLTAGARHCSPLAFDRAWHRDAWCMAKSMRLFLRFFARPYPLGGGADVPDDRLVSPASPPRLSAKLSNRF